MISKEQSARPYLRLACRRRHHPLSHHNNIPELIAQMSKINRYHTQLFRSIWRSLRATPDGDGSLLDHMTSCTVRAFPTAPGTRATTCRPGGGRWAGRLKGGRHLTYSDKPSMGEPAGDADGQARCAGRAARRQHGAGSRSITFRSVVKICGLPSF